MKQLLQGVFATLTAAQAVGQSLQGIAGIYFNEAPEQIAGVKTAMPFVTIKQQEAGQDNQLFMPPSGPYVAYTELWFKVYATDMVSAAGFADGICATLDNNRMDLTSYGGSHIDKILIAQRKKEPFMEKDSKYSTTDIAVYSGLVKFLYQVQRGN